MIVTDRFVYLHMHRTAGTFLRRFFGLFFPQSREIGYHYPIRELPRQAAHLPVLIVVREPADWYLSIYHMNMLRQASPGGLVNPVFQAVSQRGALDVSATLEGLLRLGEGTPTAMLRRRRIAAALPDTLEGNRGVGLTKDDINGFVQGEQGYLTWLFQRMAGGPSLAANLKVVQYESFKQTLPEVLEGFGVPVTEAMRQYLSDSPSLNTSANAAKGTVVSAPLRSLMRQKDAWIFENFYPQQLVD